MKAQSAQQLQQQKLQSEFQLKQMELQQEQQLEEMRLNFEAQKRESSTALTLPRIRQRSISSVKSTAASWQQIKPWHSCKGRQVKLLTDIASLTAKRLRCRLIAWCPHP